MGRNRRIRGALIVAGVGAAAVLFATGSASASLLGRGGTRVPGPCALARADGEIVQDFSIRLITCAADRWPVPGGAEKAVCIADRESGLIPTASSATGLYAGLFQHSVADWPRRYDEWTRPVWRLKDNPYNGRTNAIVAVRIANAEGWAAWAGTGC